MKYLLDTNVLSEARRPWGAARVKDWLASVSVGDLYLSALVVGEIRRGIERLKRRGPEQARVYEDWLGAILNDYADRIIPVDAEIADEWGRMSVPDPVPIVEGLMAPTAKVRNMTFVTRNTADVERIGARLLNSFES